MKAFVNFILYAAILIMFSLSCQQPYFAPVPKTNLGYLVVDGIIVNGPDSTIINLSRTQNVTDSSYVAVPETGAQVSVVGEYAENYPLIEQGNGKYISPQFNLNYNETYQLKIVTSNGKVYLSDSIPVRQTPPIDSVSWTDDSTFLNIYVTTHDPSNNTRYYRWEYQETWEYHSVYYSKLVYQNGALATRTPAQNVYYCWSNDYSTNILVGSSEKLNQDIIYQQQLLADSLYVFDYPVNIQLTLPGLSQKFVMEYSILVNQYALTEQAYNFWQNLKLNTEQLGTIFSPEPSSQIPGNIHCITTPTEPVIGYITASTLQQKRIFINHYDLFAGTPVSPQIGCGLTSIVPDSINYYFKYTNLFTPLDSVDYPTGDFCCIEATQAYCGDCTQNGGTTVKPSYWPN